MDGDELDPYSFGPEQACFGCGPHNDHGLRLRFRRQGEEVTTIYRPRHGQEGPPGLLHGGLQMTLADELGAWTIVGLRGRLGLTTSMQVRLYRPVRLDLELEGRGRIHTESEGLVVVRVSFTQLGKTTLSGRVSYQVPTVEGAERTLGRALPDGWHRFCRPAS
ncbi:MAG: PaaI family thioesterase [Myxococcota bacterium]